MRSSQRWNAVSTRMDNDSLKVFCDVVDLGSFSAAARHNGMTSSSVSQKIRELEDNRQALLFERGKKRIRLTLGGRSFEKAARSTLVKANSLRSQIGADGEDENQTQD